MFLYPLCLFFFLSLSLSLVYHSLMRIDKSVTVDIQRNASHNGYCNKCYCYAIIYLSVIKRHNFVSLFARVFFLVSKIKIFSLYLRQFEMKNENRKVKKKKLSQCTSDMDKCFKCAICIMIIFFFYSLMLLLRCTLYRLLRRHQKPTRNMNEFQHKNSANEKWKQQKKIVKNWKSYHHVRTPRSWLKLNSTLLSFNTFQFQYFWWFFLFFYFGSHYFRFSLFFLLFFWCCAPYSSLFTVIVPFNYWFTFSVAQLHYKRWCRIIT